jgi:uncharacterized protein YutE (UPF0331/DUF86 family)
MTNVELVLRKLSLINEHLRRLHERRPPKLETFEESLLLQDAVALSLLVVVQECIDVAFHVASDEGWQLAPTYRESFAVLAQHGVMDMELARTLGTTAQLRNRIAHGYASVDTERLWRELPDGLAAFSRFSAQIAAYLQDK